MEKLAYQRPDSNTQRLSVNSILPPNLEIDQHDISDSEDELVEHFSFPLQRSRRNAVELDPITMAQLNHNLQNNSAANQFLDTHQIVNNVEGSIPVMRTLRYPTRRNALQR